MFFPALCDFPKQATTAGRPRRWVTCYLQRKHELEGGNADDVREVEVEMWEVSIDIMGVVCSYSYISIVFLNVFGYRLNESKSLAVLNTLCMYTFTSAK